MWMRLTPAISARNVVFTFDHNKKGYIAYFHIRDLRRIRRYMYVAVATAIATALFSSRYDYCNSLDRYNVLNEILKLQRVQQLFDKGSYLVSSFFLTHYHFFLLAPCPISHYL